MRITVIKLKHIVYVTTAAALIIALAIAAYQWTYGNNVSPVMGQRGDGVAAHAAAPVGFLGSIAAMSAALHVEIVFDETTGSSSDSDEDAPGTDMEISLLPPDFWEPDGAYEISRVLIYHTHTHEAYQQDPLDKYVETDQWRTADAQYSVVRIGDELKAALEAAGFEVVHDLTDHEPPKLGTAYERSEATLGNYVTAGEVFDLYIDLHRDAYVDSASNANLTVDTPNGDAARVMLLVGNGKNYAEQSVEKLPKYRENLSLAQYLTQALNAEVPGIAKDVLVKDGRYNQHISPYCILLEMGNNRNMLNEALNAVPSVAKVIAEYLTAKANG